MQSTSQPKPLYPYPEAPYSQDMWESLADIADYSRNDIQNKHIREELCFVGKVKFAFDSKDTATLNNIAIEAASAGNTKRVDFLLDKKFIDINNIIEFERNGYKIKTTLLAASFQHLGLMARYLFRETKMKPEIINFRSHNQEASIVYNSETGVTIIKRIALESALQAAMLQGEFSIVSVLIMFGAIPEESDILFAAQNISNKYIYHDKDLPWDKYYIMDLLKQHCKTKLSSETELLLEFAKKKQDVTLEDCKALVETRQLLNEAKDIDRDQRIKALALEAAQHNHKETLNYLLEQKAINPNEIYEIGQPPVKHTLLTAAISRNHVNYSIISTLMSCCSEETLNFCSKDNPNLLEQLIYLAANCPIDSKEPSRQAEILAIALMMLPNIKPVDHRGRWISEYIAENRRRDFDGKDNLKTVANIANDAIKNYKKRHCDQLTHSIKSTGYAALELGLRMFCCRKRNKQQEQPIIAKSLKVS